MKNAAHIVILMVIIMAAAPGAAYAIQGHPYILQWGQSGLVAPGHFGSPQNIAADVEGNVYVTDLGNTRVQKFDNDGRFLLEWGGQGSGPGQFNSPAGIAAGNSTIYVADSKLNRIQAFGADGEFAFEWGERGSGEGQFILPSGIAYGGNDTIYVVDTGNHRVQKFSSDGLFLSEFGRSGTADDEFISPAGITVDVAGNVYVSDSGSSSIKKFGPDGNLILNIDSSVGGKQVRAQGLQVDTEGNLYVADAGNDRMLRLGPDGLSIAVWGGMGVQAGQFKMPRDVALDADGELFVVDSNGHRIQKFATPLIHEEAPADVPAGGQDGGNTGGQDEGYGLPRPSPVEGDLTKPVIMPPNDLVIEATGVLTAVDVGRALASDESGIRSLVNNAPGEFSLGMNTVIWTAIDGAGNMAIATQLVTITDTIAPVIAPVQDVTVEATGLTQNVVELAAPAATDIVGVLSLEGDAPEFFPVGRTQVTWTASDIVGNTASVTQTIHVIDTTPPEIRAPADVAAEAASPEGTAVQLGEPVFSDNGEITSITNDAPALFGAGNTTVTWLAADGSGNTASDEQVVSITDTTAPQITAPAGIIIEAVDGGANVADLGVPAVSDIHDVTITSDAPAVFPLGATTVTWTAADADGNEAAATQEVQVVDTTPPVLIVPGDITAEATGPGGNSVSLGEVIVHDATGVASIMNDAPEYFGLGRTLVTWTATDNHGNSNSSQQAVSILDTTAPSIAAPADITLEAAAPDGNPAVLGSPSADDIVEILSVHSDAPDSYPVGTTVITWTATDTSGNTATDTQEVHMVDTTPPVVTPPAGIAAEASGPDGQVVVIGEASATDAIGVGTITSDAPGLFPLGLTTVTWTAADLHGNTAQSVQNITIIDTTPPVITQPPDVTAEAGGPLDNAVDIGVVHADDFVGVASMYNDAPDSFPVGQTLITWTAMDAAGNTAQAAQTVTITDSVPPSITAPADITAEAESADGSAVNLAGANASDAVGVASMYNDAPEIFPVGQTLVTWTAVDAAGNEASDTQVVTIMDTTAPVLYAPRSLTAEAAGPDGSAIDYGTASASDDVGVVSINNDAPAVFPLGRTEVTWSAMDAAGNEHADVQQVLIVDTIPPSITPPPDVTAEAGSAQNMMDTGMAEAADTVALESVASDAPDSFPLGRTVITWTATDTSGNSANATQIIEITDTTPPAMIMPDDITLEATSAGQNGVTLVAPEALDAVGPVEISGDAPAAFPLGQTMVTWTATDGAGNAATGTQTITIVDTTPPSITPPEDITLEAVSVLENIADIGQAVAEDAVGVQSVHNDAPDAFPYGTTVITWTATDTSGNGANGTQVIAVVDTTAPSVVPPPDVVAEAAAPDGNLVQIGTATANDITGVASLYSDAPDSFPLGRTMVTWTAADADGNEAAATQTVSLVDTTPPELAVPPDVTVDAVSMEMPVNTGTASSTDLIDPSPSVTGDAPAVFPLGMTLITWNSTDAAGNFASATQTVDVQACGKPVSYYNMIVGSAGDDTITGTAQPDLIFSLGGDDIVSGGRGGDCIFGGEGDDILFGQGGDDTITGGGGNDIIKGNSGMDLIYGGLGADVMDGGDDADSCGAPDPGDLTAKCES